MLKTNDTNLIPRLRALAVAGVLSTAVAAAPAFAQSTTPETTQPPAAAQPVPATGADEGAAPAAPSAEPTAPGATQAEPAPKGDQVTEMIGLPVFTSDGQRIGAVGKIEPASDGKVAAIHVRTGGFLGFGTKLVVIPAEQFEQAGETVKLALTADEVDKLPEAEPAKS
ncbi:MAG: PRC-barrel domain-containing protein [Pseudomonadota bacterium]